MKRYIKSSEQTDADWELQSILKNANEDDANYSYEEVERIMHKLTDEMSKSIRKYVYYMYRRPYDLSVTKCVDAYLMALVHAGVISEAEFDILFEAVHSAARR